MAEKKDKQDNTATVLDGEIINQGEFINRLGINQVVWTKHPEYREWLEQQEGVEFQARKSFIPAIYVEHLRDFFQVQPVQRRPRRANTGSTTKNKQVDYTTFSIPALVEEMDKEKALLEGGEDYTQQIAEAEKALADLRQKQEAVKGANDRLTLITKALAQKKHELDEQRKRQQEEEALLASLGI